MSVQGKMFSVKPPKLEDALPVMRRMIGRIFAQGGPDGMPWAPRKSDGGQAFNGGARFLATLAGRVEGNRAVMSMGGPFPFAHNYGVTFTHPGSSKFQAFEWKGRMWFTWYTKPHKITIPARPLMVWMEPEMKEVARVLGTQVITFKLVENGNG